MCVCVCVIYGFISTLKKCIYIGQNRKYIQTKLVVFSASGRGDENFFLNIIVFAKENKALCN